jgi:hypothetical protein
MGVQFEWQAGSDEGQWETIAKTDKGPRRRRLARVPWWAWVVVGLIVAGLGALSYRIVRRRYEELQRQAEFQIQGVIDLEARAYASRDVKLFLDQQDREAHEWYSQQARRVRERCSTPLEGQGAVRDPCAAVHPAKIEDVNLRGNVAWVQVLEGQPPVRKVRFYRQTDLGWRRTAPRPQFWETAIRVQYGELFVQYHEKDAPDVVYLEELIATTYANVCATTLCPATNTLIVDFTIEPPVYQSPYLISDPGPEGRDRLFLSSPWLSGLPVEGSWDEGYVERLTHAVAYATVTRAMRSTTKRNLNPLQQAVADEYAAWYAQRDTSALPLLGPIIEQQGEEVIPALLRSAKASRTSSEFLNQWRGLSLGGSEIEAERARAYFEALLNLEREALRTGRKQTFLMVQDIEWRGIQSRFFEQVRRSGGSVPLARVRVGSVDVSSERARARVEEPLPAFLGQPPQSLRNVVYFRLQDGDWRHANVLDALLWTPTPTQTPSTTAAPSSPSPTPTPSAGS